VSRSGDGLTVERKSVALRSLPRRPSATVPAPFACGIDGPGRRFMEQIAATVTVTELSAESVPESLGADPFTAYLDAARAPFPLTLRSIRPGDRFRPLGMRGTRPVKKFLADAKVPRAARASVPLLVSRGRILWIAGYRIAHDGRLTPATARVIKVELLLA
jgi:tRNA(Ile)-lysidine synthase